tara:strand:+ start:3440 stop:4498 length:1059 start_codon:yes stop_codon:yes gene_type:complete
MPKYTAEEIATLVVMRSAGSTYTEIRELMLEKYGHDRLVQNLKRKYDSIVSTKEGSKKETIQESLAPKPILSQKNWRAESATRRQLRTLASLTAPDSGIKDRMALADSFETRGMTKGEASDLIQLNMGKSEIETTNPVILSKKKKTRNWSEMQIKLLFDMYHSNKTWNQISEVIGRSSKACQAKRSKLMRSGEWFKMKEESAVPSRLRKFLPTERKKIETVVEPEPLEDEPVVLQSNEKNENSFAWTRSQDMNILVNFYEMSIDEVREAFARPFWVVAQRLEMLFDSSEPEHIAMLMEASDIVMKRKSPRTEKPQKPSRKERRVAKKAERRAAKVARLEAKMERKLNRLRGE